MAQHISQFSEKSINKPLDTGRAKLWRQAAVELSNSPWIGVGLYSNESWTRTLSDRKEIRLSIHSYYWAILHEAGIIGLGAILLLFGFIWYVIATGPHELYSRLSLAFFGAILVQQISEVQLSTGTFTIGVSVWMAIAAGASLANDSRTSRIFVDVSELEA